MGTHREAICGRVPWAGLSPPPLGGACGFSEFRVFHLEFVIAFMNRFFKFALRSLLGLLVLIAILWIADYISFRYRLSKGTSGDPLASVRIQTTYAIPHKDGRAEYVFGEPQNVACARSIFPHAGAPPCWYLQKTTAQPVQM